MLYGRQSYCKICNDEQIKIYYSNNRERILEYKKNWQKRNPGYKTKYTRLKVYGLTNIQFERILKNQDFKCAVCRDLLDLKKPKSICVDHCHKTGIVRGILCFGCNTAEGNLRTPEIAQRMADYMRENELFYISTNGNGAHPGPMPE
jgi:hypothetical protein